MYVCYHSISKTTRFHYPDELLMDRTGYEKSEFQRFCCENVLLRKYGGFNGFIVLELLTGTEKLQKLSSH